VGSSYSVPSDGQVEIGRPDGSTSTAAVTASSAVTGGQAVTILTIRAE